jgi:hypothetical protein
VQDGAAYSRHFRVTTAKPRFDVGRRCCGRAYENLP